MCYTDINPTLTETADVVVIPSGPVSLIEREGGLISYPLHCLYKNDAEVLIPILSLLLYYHGVGVAFLLLEMEKKASTSDLFIVI